MDIEFHYYMTYLVAKKAGFSGKESSTIAYSSQYIDDNDIIFNINKDTGEYYENYISQTMNILKAKKKLMRIYPIFHFIPGEYDCIDAQRRDGKMHLLNCTPDSEHAKYITRESFKSGNLHRIGIATHSFVDTWAHQNFIGYFDDFNSMKGLLESASPNVGHADAGHHPDMPGLVWEDKRLLGDHRRVDNKERFLAAASRLLEELCKVVDSNMSQAEIAKRQTELDKDLSNIMGERDAGNKLVDERIARCIKLSKTDAYGKSELLEYDHNIWFEEAINESIRGLVDRKNSIVSEYTFFKDKYTWKDTNTYKDTDWYKFQEEVKAHQELAYGYLTEKVFSKMDLDSL